MNATSTIPFADLVFVSPKATTSAAAVTSRTVAAPHSVVELIGERDDDIDAAISAFLGEPAIIGVDMGAGDDICVESARATSRVSIRNVTTFAVAAASEIISNEVAS